MIGELINRKTKKIADIASGKSRLYCKISGGRMYFASGAVKEFGLIAGKYLHFIQSGSVWSFFENDNPDGFMLSGETKGSKNLMISCAALITVFKKSTGAKDQDMFFIMDSGELMDGNKVIQVNTVKTYNAILKQVV